MASKIDELLQWARLHNTSLHESVVVYQDPVTGLSFQASEDIPPGTTLATSSYETSLSYLNAAGSSAHFKSHSSDGAFPQPFIEALRVENPHIIGHFFLVQQYLLGEKSFWWNYIRLLPQPDDQDALGVPVSWPEADLKFLAGTNAEPPIEKKLTLWKNEWGLGIWNLKPHMSDWHMYSYKLYQWAASIFSSRSFRVSLTIPDTIPMEDSTSPEIQEMNREHIRRDNFSVLFPVLDIGNHDGVNRVEWSKSPESGHFTFSSTQTMAKGSQIFNFYGNKSNSELLVGYGFILHSPEQDIVNLRMTPAADAAELRRTQSCHRRNAPFQPGEEFMFYVRRQSVFQQTSEGLVALPIFSHGLFEALICMIANAREGRYILDNPDYCIQTPPSMFSGPLYKALFQSLQILLIKLTGDKQKIIDAGKDLGYPQNQNQRMALEYRERKIAVLEEALLWVTQHLEVALKFSSFHDLISANAITGPESRKQFGIKIEEPMAQPTRCVAGLLPLETAFDWLRANYPDIHESVTEIIAKDQGEPLPLKWNILVEDWDHSYWVVWIYIIWMLWARDGSEFLNRHPSLSKWMSLMKSSATDPKEAYEKFHAKKDEYTTINDTIEEITWLPQFRPVRSLLETQKGGWEPLRNFASFVAKNETVHVKVGMNVARKRTDAEVEEMYYEDFVELEDVMEETQVEQRVLAVC